MFLRADKKSIRRFGWRADALAADVGASFAQIDVGQLLAVSVAADQGEDGKELAETGRIAGDGQGPESVDDLSFGKFTAAALPAGWGNGRE